MGNAGLRTFSTTTYKAPNALSAAMNKPTMPISRKGMIEKLNAMFIHRDTSFRKV